MSGNFYRIHLISRKYIAKNIFRLFYYVKNNLMAVFISLLADYRYEYWFNRRNGLAEYLRY
jgi:hypothetical protein